MKRPGACLNRTYEELKQGYQQQVKYAGELSLNRTYEELKLGGGT